MLYIGALGTVFSIMMTSLCKEIYQFILAQGILLGISMALLACPMLALVGQHIKIKRGTAMGIVLGGSSLGGVVWPIVINELLTHSNVGFPWTMRIVGFIMLPLLLISCLCCRPAPTPVSVPASSPSPPPSQQTEPKEPPARPKTDFSIMKTPTMLLSCLAFFIIYFGMFSPFFFTTSYAVQQGFSETLSFYTISIVNGASFFGRVLPGIIADKYGKFNCCTLAVCFSGIIALCWTTATSVAGLVIFSAAYGFTSGVSCPPLFEPSMANKLTKPRQFSLFNKPAQHRLPRLKPSDSLLELSWALRLFRMHSTITPNLFKTLTHHSRAMAGVPISGELAGKYGYLALSIYSGVSLLVGSLLLVIARLAQSRDLFAIV